MSHYNAKFKLKFGYKQKQTNRFNSSLRVLFFEIYTIICTCYKIQDCRR